MSTTLLVHLIETLVEEISSLGNHIDYDVRRGLENLKEKLDELDLTTHSSLDTNMTCALQDTGIDGTVYRLGCNKMVVSIRISYTHEEFVFEQEEDGLWFLTKAHIRRRDSNGRPLENYLHEDLYIGGYSDEQMIKFARDILPTGMNTAVNRFFGKTLY